MYYDKCFQTDNHFPLIVFNHKQIKHSTTGGFLLAETCHSLDIADPLLNINQDVLEDLTNQIYGYIYGSEEFVNMTLYDWIQLSRREKLSKRRHY
jgi:hypothetical protein